MKVVTGKEVLRFSHTTGVSILLNKAAPLPLSLPRGDSFPLSTTSDPLCSPASSDRTDTSESQRTCICHDCSLPVLRLDCHSLLPTPPPSPAHQIFPVNGMNCCPNSAIIFNHLFGCHVSRIYYFLFHVISQRMGYARNEM